MNCISWDVGHLAVQTYGYWVSRAQKKELPDTYRGYGFGNPAVTPPLADALALWREACTEADKWLDTVTEETLKAVLPSPSSNRPPETTGTLLVRNIYHILTHAGEVHAIRQQLGHKPPDFVNLHGWQYKGME